MRFRGVHIENLKRGQWIAIAGCREEEIGEQCSPREYTGRPSRVVEVSPPFVCLNDGIITTVVDSRYWRFTKVTDRYAKAVLQGRQTEPCPNCHTPDIYFYYGGNDKMVAECNTCDYSESAVLFWKRVKRSAKGA